MSVHSKWVLQRKKSAARIFLGKYLSIQPGDFASPQFCKGGFYG
jgi:hypothetical protein